MTNEELLASMQQAGRLAIVSVGDAPKLNGYVCFYGSKRIEVNAETSYAAQKQAQKLLKVTEKNRHRITVVLAEKDGSTVTHNGAEL